MIRINKDINKCPHCSEAELIIGKNFGLDGILQQSVITVMEM